MFSGCVGAVVRGAISCSIVSAHTCFFGLKKVAPTFEKQGLHSTTVLQQPYFVHCPALIAGMATS
jgi:hypothetical protein